MNSECFAAFFFSALRFLVAVSSDLSGRSCVLKALFSKPSRRPDARVRSSDFSFSSPHPAIKGLLRNRFVTIIRVGSSHQANGLEDRCAGNQAAPDCQN